MAEQIEVPQKFQSNLVHDENTLKAESGRFKTISLAQMDELTDDDQNITISSVNPKDIYVIKPIGSGSFGTVYLW